MKARNTGAAESPPKPAPAIAPVRLPNHTAVASCCPEPAGLAPMNQASARLSVVPVLPKISCPATLALPPVPPVTTPRSTLASQSATSLVSTSSPGSEPLSMSTLPSGPTTFCTTKGLWCTPPLAMVAMTVAISIGVASTVPIDRVRNWSFWVGRVCWMPIWWARVMSLPWPTLVERRTNAQFTEPAVAAHRLSMPPSSSALFVDTLPKRFTEHGAEPSTWSLGE